VFLNPIARPTEPLGPEVPADDNAAVLFLHAVLVTDEEVKSACIVTKFLPLTSTESNRWSAFVFPPVRTLVARVRSVPKNQADPWFAESPTLKSLRCDKIVSVTCENKNVPFPGKVASKTMKKLMEPVSDV